MQASTNNAVEFNYKLDGKILATITSFKYLGVQITENFSWDMHVNSITSTASQKPGMIKRVLLEAPKKIRKIAYVTFCRPLLEYACGAWDPFLAKHIDQIEMGQQRAVRSISKLRGRERVTSKKESLGLELLQDAKVKLLLKISPSDTISRLVDNFNNITT